MKIFKTYLYELIKVLGILGMPFLVISAAYENYIAVYLCWTAALVAVAGPISMSLKERATK